MYPPLRRKTSGSVNKVLNNNNNNKTKCPRGRKQSPFRVHDNVKDNTTILNPRLQNECLKSYFFCFRMDSEQKVGALKEWITEQDEIPETSGRKLHKYKCNCWDKLIRF